MEDSDKWNRAEPGQSRLCRETRESSTQTDSRIKGHDPRLSKVNLFTLLSLWMELFPREQPEDGENSQVSVGATQREMH
ncbi:hypothetical protein XENOCAPTIV_023571 [Xenoophorus captivus]|uniref:Uncharacterized protein n=1 Tax=Xenoophorus captivus TaxID=1517983 RepID=A0ABV0RF83_9TELE